MRVLDFISALGRPLGWIITQVVVTGLALYALFRFQTIRVIILIVLVALFAVCAVVPCQLAGHLAWRP